MKFGKLLLGSACLLGLILAPLGAHADDDDDDDGNGGGGSPIAELLVRCDRGESINDALALAPGFARFTVIVRGVCTENVFIAADNVTVKGGPVAGGRVEGRFTVDGARRVRIEDLTISGGDRGVRVNFGAYVRITNVTIENMSRTGVFVFNGGVASIEDTTIIGPTEDGVLAAEGSVVDIRDSTIEGAMFGVSAGNGSTVNIEDSFILDSVVDGMSIAGGSSARVVGIEISGVNEVAISVFHNGHMVLRNSSIASANQDQAVLFLDGGSIRLDGGNTITSANVSDGITIRNGSYLRQRTNLGDGPDMLVGGLRVESQSYANFSRAHLEGDIDVLRDGVLEIRGDTPGAVTVNGDVDVAFDSLLTFRFDGGEVFGDVTCADAESSLQIGTPFVLITGTTSCTGFD